MKIIIAITIILIVEFFALKARKKNVKMQEEVDNTKTINDPQELIKMGYRPLINVVNKVTSMMDPRPGAVIRDYKLRGWDVILCPAALDRKGRQVAECSSLWGKWNLHAVK